MSNRAVIWLAVSSQKQAEEDKISLPFQEEKAREWCAANDYEVVEVLKVEGHSRSDPNLVRLLKLYEKKGVTAYARLQELWDEKGFDVLVAYSSDRLGRSGTLINFVVETTYYEGMQVCFTEAGGLMARNTFRMSTMIGVAQATMPMDAFVEKTREAKEKQAAKGFAVGRWPLSHLPVRDAVTGKAIAITINEATRPLYEAIATLLIEGLSWAAMSGALATRYGLYNPQGRMYDGTTIRRLILNAWVYGHNMTGQKVFLTTRPRGRWIFDQEYPPPDGIQMFYNVVPPLFEGERMEQLKAELRRRFEIRGRTSTLTAHRFARLCVCDACGHLLSVHTNSSLAPHRQRVGYICPTSRLSIPPDRRCHQRFYTSVRVIQAFVNQQLERYLDVGTVAYPASVPRVSETAQLQQSVMSLNSRLDRLVEEMSFDLPDALRTRYRKQISDLHEELAQKEGLLKAAAAREAVHHRVEEARHQAIETIQEMTLEGFWQMPDPWINQTLLRFFGDFKIAVRDKQIVSLKEFTRRKL